MSMTREEAIALLNEQYETCKRIYDCSADQRKSYPNVPQFMGALDMALTALRPVSREQVWGVGAWETVADEGFVDTMGRQVFHLHCPVCDFFWRETGHKKYFRFCPACGAPMTDEAVEMVMERLEALKDDSTTD